MNEISVLQREAFSLEETAKSIGIGRTLAYDAARRGEIPTIRIGRRLLVPRAALEQLLATAATDGSRSLVERTAELANSHAGSAITSPTHPTQPETT
jgi:excisionase family DNA binding protein